ncbi:MAG: BlaB/IND/MUS family subclass B1 metallo-beta-lactamase [Bacteroidota bacterium]
MHTSAIIVVIFLFSLNKICAQSNDSSLVINHLTGDFYVFTTFNFYKGNRIPANGMYVVTNKGVILVDSPWDTTQFQPLLDHIKAKHHQHVVMCIATHFHEDRTGGLSYYRQQGIATYTTRKTDELSAKGGMKRAQFLIDKDTVMTVGQYSFRTYFPGHGHTVDNIVVWFEKEKILYGGCLIKSVKDSTLGNLADASVTDYATTLKNVQQKCKKPKHIIPGHNDWTSTESLAHSLKMAQELKKKY